MNAKRIAVVAGAFAALAALPGCMPMSSTELSSLVQGLAKDPAVACFNISSPGIISIHFVRTGMSNSSSNCGSDIVAAGVGATSAYTGGVIQPAAPTTPVSGPVAAPPAPVTVSPAPAPPAASSK